MSDGSVLTFKTRASNIRKASLNPYKKWDPDKKYKLPVVLVSFSDCDFKEDHDLQFYKDVFNKKGFNKRNGPGCVADYFRDQSLGKFNVEFDVVGPVKLTSKQKNYTMYNYGFSQFRDAVMQTDADLNYSDYDWDGDGKAETVIIVYAGYGGNEKQDPAKWCIWPNTDSFGLKLDGVEIAQYSASSEIWSNDASCGIGTICHEFSHVLGLPDLYPTSGDEFSVVDEWDLMDGGNYADDGWCPPNYSILERELLGWQSPEDLIESTEITEMPSYNSSGKAYRIINDAHPSEFFLLENRQREGWDFMLPGHGLLITHVDFDQSAWSSNRVNTSPSHHRYEYFHPDGLDYNYYDDLRVDGKTPYKDDGRSIRLQNTAYPYIDSLGIVHNSLTDTSTPSAKLFNKQTNGTYLMGKPITSISENEGTISFCFSSEVFKVDFSIHEYATFYCSGTAVEVPEGIEAYVIRGIDNGTLKYYKIADGVSDRIIPKNTGVLLVDKGGSKQIAHLLKVTSTKTYDGLNLLYGSDKRGVIASAGNEDAMYYKLSYGSSLSNTNKIGWYWGEDNGAPFYIDANRAWLVIPRGAAKTRSCYLFDDVPEEENGDMYDLNGRRLSSFGKYEMYLQDGKKYINRRR